MSETALRATAASRRQGFADPTLRATNTHETKAALHVARCWRYVDDAGVARAFDLADTVAKLCWRLTR